MRQPRRYASSTAPALGVLGCGAAASDPTVASAPAATGGAGTTTGSSGANGSDDGFAWSGDDQNGSDPSPVRACAAEDFRIVFCPAARP